MPDVVRDMHARSGLTEEVRRSTVTLRRGRGTGAGLRPRARPRAPHGAACGNSIATDRGFLARDMPELDAHLHYRMVDVSSIKELCRRWFPRVYYAKPEKGLAHRALADIRESIRELDYYRRTLFVAAARPDVARRPTPWPPPCPRDRRNPLRPAPRTRYSLVPSPAPAGDRMVGVAQLVEHLVVVQVVAGSSPVTHPMPRPRRPARTERLVPFEPRRAVGATARRR